MLRFPWVTNETTYEDNHPASIWRTLFVNMVPCYLRMGIKEVRGLEFQSVSYDLLPAAGR